jgi:hypothetical protein
MRTSDRPEGGGGHPPDGRAALRNRSLGPARSPAQPEQDSMDVVARTLPTRTFQDMKP